MELCGFLFAFFKYCPHHKSRLSVASMATRAKHLALRILTLSECIHVEVMPCYRRVHRLTGAADYAKLYVNCSYTAHPGESFSVSSAEHCLTCDHVTLLHVPMDEPTTQRGIDFLDGLLGTPYTSLVSLLPAIALPKKYKHSTTRHAVDAHPSSIFCSQAALLVCMVCGKGDACIRPDTCLPGELMQSLLQTRVGYAWPTHRASLLYFH